ncbi:MAG: Cell division control protein 6, partial [Methanoculleus marisnigri]
RPPPSAGSFARSGKRRRGSSRPTSTAATTARRSRSSGASSSRSSATHRRRATSTGSSGGSLPGSGTYNTLLYQILRLYEKWDVKTPGVFAVASDLGLNLYAEADESVRSVFHPTEVNFPPYRMVEVRGILASGRPSTRGWSRSSSSTALRESPPAGSHPGGGGWAQKGCTRRCDGSSAGGQVAGAPGLPEGERALLSRIAEMSVAGADMIGGGVFEEVKDYPPVGKTTYHEHLKRLARAGPGGEVRLRYDPEEVLAVCTGPEESRIDRQPGPARNS